MEIVKYGTTGHETPHTPNCGNHNHSDNASIYDKPQPFVRGRVDREGYFTGCSSIDRDNNVLQRKLKEIQTRNSPFAASDIGRAVRKSSTHQHQVWQSFKHHSAQTPSRGKSPQKTRAQEVAACKLVMARKLSELYAVRKDSFVVQTHLGKGLDCNDRWQQRTGIYSSSCSDPGWRSSSSLDSRPCTAPEAGRGNPGVRSSNRPTSACRRTDSGSSCSSKGVPKTLSVALCGGCGARSFFHADGAQLKPCPGCGHAFYCSDACRRFDYPSHKAECRFHTTGRSVAAGIRPSEDYWVMNRAMTAARRLLQQQQQRSSCSRPGTASGASLHGQAPQHPSSHQRRCTSAQSRSNYQRQPETYQEWDRDSAQECAWQQQLQQQLEDVRLHEQQEALAQQQVELRASQGLDGPRPCLCSSGLELLGGYGLRAAVREASGTGSAASKRAVGPGSTLRTRRARQAWKSVNDAYRS